jgi:hypothetical protein
MNKTTPTRGNVVVLKQMLNLIARGMVNPHALETGVEAKARTYNVVEPSFGDALRPTLPRHRTQRCL